jgi:hypothetical protein
MIEFSSLHSLGRCFVNEVAEMKLYPIKLNPRRKTTTRRIPGMFLFVFSSHKFSFFYVLLFSSRVFFFFLSFSLSRGYFGGILIFMWIVVCGGGVTIFGLCLDCERWRPAGLHFSHPVAPSASDPFSRNPFDGRNLLLNCSLNQTSVAKNRLGVKCMFIICASGAKCIDNTTSPNRDDEKVFAGARSCMKLRWLIWWVCGLKQRGKLNDKTTWKLIKSLQLLLLLPLTDVG